jgi:hypothetical protein
MRISVIPAAFRSEATLAAMVFAQRPGTSQPGGLFPPGLSFHLDLVRIENEPIEDRVAEGSIDDHLVPFFNRDLAGYQRGTFDVVVVHYPYQGLKMRSQRENGKSLLAASGSGLTGTTPFALGLFA